MLAKQPVTVNGIEFDALISQDLTFEATTPEYAVEKGFTVSDAVIKNAEQLSMVLYLTPTPVTWYKKHGGGQERVNAVMEQLQELYFKAEPVEVVTSDTVFSNMAIINISFSKTVEAGYAMEIPIAFKKIRITEAKTTTIPANYGKSGKTKASAGNANKSSGTSKASESSNSSGSGSSGSSSSSSKSSSSSGKSNKSSILYGLGKKVGLI